MLIRMLFSHLFFIFFLGNEEKRHAAFTRNEDTNYFRVTYWLAGIDFGQILLQAANGPAEIASDHLILDLLIWCLYDEINGGFCHPFDASEPARGQLLA